MFLGWDEAGWRAATSAADAASCLDAAAAWLLRDGPDLTGTLVALPGARAGRRLLERLVARAGEALVPPEITTAGQLTDLLLELPRPRASGLARNLAWQLALAGLPPEQLAALWRARPADDDRAGWRALAEEARGRHAELGREGLRLHDVVPLAPPGAERARWQALAAAHDDYRRRLTALGLDDPHDARRQALDEGRLDESARSRHARLVLVGVSEHGGLNRRLLALPDVARRTSALVCAPPSEQAAFDALGAVLPAAWARREIPLRDEQWHVEEHPAGQAARVVSVLASLRDRHHVEEVTLGVPGLGGAGDDIVPHLEQQLSAHGLAIRPAVGAPLRRTGPWRLLDAAGRLLSRRGYSDLAQLARHPDLDAWLRARPELAPLDLDLPELLDEYFNEHLPGEWPRAWLSPSAADERRRARAAGRHERLLAASAALDGLLAPLGPHGASPRAPLSAWAAPLRALLLAVYGERDGDPQALDEDSRAALAALGEALAEAESVPAALAAAAPLSAGEALEALLAGCARATLPPPARADALELLGWLELPLDDARATIVVNVEEGRLPEPAGGLPDGLRAQLGMPDDALRRARDAHALTVLLHGRRDVALVTGRRRQGGDPARPSRLLFHAPADEAARRVLRWADGGTTRAAARAPAATATGGEDRAVGAPSPPAAHAPAPVQVPGAALGDTISVTAFRDWFRSPYLFYLRHVLRVESVDDDARELDGRAFGTLLHGVLDGLALPEAAELDDERRLAAFLLARLERRAREQYGERPLPALAVQLRQARARLLALARWQAARQREGWRVASAEQRCEWSLAVPDGPPIRVVGRIDRIDVRDGAWAILDYKTGDKAAAPRKTHGPVKGSGAWKDVQLPLYRHLAADWAAARGLRGAPELGYVLLPRAARETGLALADWSAEELARADAAAGEAVAAMRRGEAFADTDGFPEDEPQLAALAGLGVLAGPDDEADEAESDGGGAS